LTDEHSNESTSAPGGICATTRWAVVRRTGRHPRNFSPDR